MLVRAVLGGPTENTAGSSPLATRGAIHGTAFTSLIDSRSPRPVPRRPVAENSPSASMAGLCRRSPNCSPAPGPTMLALIGEIEIDVTRMLRDSDVDHPLRHLESKLALRAASYPLTAPESACCEWHRSGR
jgi:hypothetical protein